MQIPFAFPILAPDSGWKRFAVRVAAGEAAWHNIRDSEALNTPHALAGPEMQPSQLLAQET
jgi:hypothetical protein